MSPFHKTHLHHFQEALAPTATTSHSRSSTIVFVALQNSTIDKKLVVEGGAVATRRGVVGGGGAFEGGVLSRKGFRCEGVSSREMLSRGVLGLRERRREMLQLRNGWNLLFLFLALGGLLFGYDIGATSGATISLQSPELSGISWFNLSAIQLGLVFKTRTKFNDHKFTASHALRNSHNHFHYLILDNWGYD
ncbi:hypothetical protein JHK86_055282 [Glycine max]|nr:hypothetical protein JHK86_055282 [Glycine max]